MKQIEHLIEPKRLLLCWKSLQGTHTNYVVGEVLPAGGEFVLRYFLGQQDFSAARNDGFVGLPAFRLDERQAEYTQGVKDALMRRLPPRTRTDFPQYLERLGLSKHSGLSDFALVGYTEARLPGDGFFLVHSFDGALGPLEFVTEIVGIRHGQFKQAQMKVRDELLLAPEPGNPRDPEAIAVLFGALNIGYINRCQVAIFHRWLRSGCRIRASVQRLNGTEDSPRVVAFVEVLPPATVN